MTKFEFSALVAKLVNAAVDNGRKYPDVQADEVDSLADEIADIAQVTFRKEITS